MPNEFARETKVLLSVAMNGCVGDVTRNAIFLPFGVASDPAEIRNDKLSAVISATAGFIMSASLAAQLVIYF